MGNAKLLVTTADPDQYYVTEHPDPWFYRSNVSNAQYLDLIVRNQSRRTATNLELLVTVPGNLGPGGWMIVIEPSDTGEFDSLMNSADYLQYIKDRQE